MIRTMRPVHDPVDESQGGVARTRALMIQLLTI